MGNLLNSTKGAFGSEEVLIVDTDGFAKLVRCLANQTFTVNDSRLHLNETVSEVHYNLTNDSSVSGVPNYGVYVKTSSDNEYWAQYAIITFTVRVFTVYLLWYRYFNFI